MTPEKSVTTQLSGHNGSFTLADLYPVIQKIRYTSPQEQSLKVTALEYMQIRRLADIQRVIETNEVGTTLFGMRIEVDPLL